MKKIAVVPVILCGGSGMRLWPLSREKFPKQFVPLLDGRSLFDEAVLRGRAVCKGQVPVCVTVDNHKFLVQDALDALGVDADIVVEPASRNTAASICLAALTLLKRDPEAIMLVLPSDHFLDGRQAFEEAVCCAEALACQGKWVLLGINPDHASSAYGYISVGQQYADNRAFHVEGFCEKPEIGTAGELIARGWVWNAGISIVRAGTVVEEMAEHVPAVLRACQRAMNMARQSEGFVIPQEEAFLLTPTAQVDREVLEKSHRTSVVLFEGDWKDVGQWPMLESLAESKDMGNRACGDAIVRQSRNTYVRSPHRLTVALGLENIAIVDTPDALLVAEKGALDGLAGVVAGLKRDGRSEAEAHVRVARPWGHYDVKANEPGYKVKCVLVRPGAALSNQFHYHRAEHWIVVKGTATICCDGNEREVAMNESVFIPQGTIHRLENRTEDNLELVEVQTGDYLGEDDIVRLDDVYGRL